MPSCNRRQRCAQLPPLLSWICSITAALALRYGCYGSNQVSLGPSSSRLLKASSVFVEEVRVRDEKNTGLALYGLVKRPGLTVDSNWTTSELLYVESDGRQGMSMWLNEGSAIWVKWEVVHGSGSYEDSVVVLLKGEQNAKELDRVNLSNGTAEAEYRINEDDSYHVGILNLSPWSMVTRLKLNISSKIYDTSEATSVCSTGSGICKLKLSFPSTQYIVVTTPNGDVPIMRWKVQVSFVARLVSYFVVVGCLVVGIHLILRCLKVPASHRAGGATPSATETEPMASAKETTCTYRTNEEATTSSSSFSGDLDCDKICAICYNETRDCFFTPCGHSISCCACARRIVEESNACPICRRVVHKVRRLTAFSKVHGQHE